MTAIGRFDWPYLTLKGGQLYDESGELAGNFPMFSCVADAEAYLEENDIRGTVYREVTR